VPVFAFALGATPLATALDVEPGLWEITTEGMAGPQKACLTRALLDADFSNPRMPPGLTCTNEIKEQTGTRIASHSVCTGTMSMEGDTVVEVQGRKAMRMQSSSVLTIAGQMQQVNATATYRWLSSDCGDVQPIDPNTAFQ
jgi:hypothetical protein